MSKLFIVRGLPGSGKSTLAKQLSLEEKADWVEADMYFVDKKTGVYAFDAAKLGAAHEWCIRQAREAMYDGVPVIVSNTFTRYRELEDYLACADRLGIPVVIIECLGQYGSVHNVPDTTMDRMRSRWQSNDTLLGGVTVNNVTLQSTGLFKANAA